MRSFKALSLYVCLAVSLHAATWFELHSKGIEVLNARDFSGAAELFRLSLSAAGNPLQRGLSSNDLGVVLHRLARDKEAKIHLETAFGIWQSLPDQKATLAQTAEALAAVNRTLGDYPASEAVLRTALKTPPAEPEQLALILNELGDILREVGQSRESYGLFEKPLSLSGISPRRRLDATIGRADLNRDAHNYAAAFEGWNQGLEIVRSNHWLALEAATLRGLAVTFMDHDEPARAEPILRKALAIFESQDVPTHQISSTLSCLGQLYQRQGKYAMAAEVELRAIEVAEKSLGQNHPQVAVLYEMLGDAVAGRKQLDQAHGYYDRAFNIMATRFGEKSAIAAAVSASWAAVEQRSNRNAEAAADYEKALTVLNDAGPEAEALRETIVQRYTAVCKALHRKTSLTSLGYKPRSQSQP